MSRALPLTLVPDKLYALGDCIENNGWISWLPAGRGGYESLNSYLLVKGRAGLFVDTQLPVLEQTIVEQARQFDLDDVTIILTRSVEFDSLGNAEPLERAVPLKRLYVHYMAWQWIYFRDRPVPTAAELPWEPRTIEKHDRFEIAPGREVTMLGAPLRLLVASWVYDHATRTLFTSDGFSHVPATDPAQRVVTAENDTTSQEEVLAHLSTKWDWLEEADTDPPRRYLDDVLSTYDVETIAPTLGCILSGRDVVERHHAMIDASLLALGQRRTTANGNGG